MRIFISLTLAFVLAGCCEQSYYALKLPEPDLEMEAQKELEKELEKKAADGVDRSKITGVTLLPADFPMPNVKALPLTERIHELLKPEEENFEVYTEAIPKADGATFKMIPIKGGTYVMGSPEDEKGRGDDEVQREVTVGDFWMMEVEVQWQHVNAFFQNGQARNKDGSIDKDNDINTNEPANYETDDLFDAITQPTVANYPLYASMEPMGYNEDQPCVAFTHHAASWFCAWLTAQTGHYYRLPTEAEWEYACRAGTSTDFSFGDDAGEIGDYGWYFENSGNDEKFEGYMPAREKKPNPWGLYDMHGNVAEWCLDFYEADRKAIQNGMYNPVVFSIERYPRVAKGGHWKMSDTLNMRSAARLASEPLWKEIDPQIPKSIWYLSDGQMVGFRVVRPVQNPSVEEMHLLWNTGPGEL